MAYEKGDKVDIIAGPFAGKEATIDKLNKSSITILVESIGTLLKVTMKPQHLLQ
jgi:transcription antitermination factor NusG